MTTTAPALASSATSTGTTTRKLYLGALTAIVIGSMVGSGIFSLPQKIAAGAGPIAVLIAKGITGVGSLALALVCQNLLRRKPELNAGPYAYTKAGFGPFIGFQ
jgi:arginine:ornithine antiporter / lysine permease